MLQLPKNGCNVVTVACSDDDWFPHFERHVRQALKNQSRHPKLHRLNWPGIAAVIAWNKALAEVFLDALELLVVKKGARGVFIQSHPSCAGVANGGWSFASLDEEAKQHEEWLRHTVTLSVGRVGSLNGGVTVSAFYMHGNVRAGQVRVKPVV